MAAEGARFTGPLVVVDGKTPGQTGFQLGTGTKTATATAGAATLNKASGAITTQSLTTAQNAVATFTITNSIIVAGSHVFVSVANGTNSAGTAVVARVQPAAGSVAVDVVNVNAAAFNGTLVLHFMVVNP